MADESINRVARKVQELKDSYSGDPALYFYGVAKNIAHEYFRTPPASLLARNAAPPPLGPSDDSDTLQEALVKCFNKLPEDERRFILGYYTHEKKAKVARRKALAEEFNLTPEALRQRAHRLRVKLQRCIEKELDSSA